MDNKLFYEDIKTESYPVFLIGNGINRNYCDDFSWDNIIKKLANFSLPEKNTDFEVSNTELVNLLDIDDSLRNNEFKAIENSWKKDLQCPLLDFIKAKGGQILTTNFDHNIEQYFNRHLSKTLQKKRKNAKGDTECFKAHKYYTWNTFWGTDDSDLKIWHIHGEIDEKKSESILFSFSRYASAIAKVKQLRHPDDHDWRGANTWLELFFKSPLIIVGLALGHQEIFLRYLLLQRYSYQKRLGQIEKSYYLVSKNDDSRVCKKAEVPCPIKANNSIGVAFLQYLDFKLVEFESFSEIYHNDIWTNMLGDV